MGDRAVGPPPHLRPPTSTPAASELRSPGPVVASPASAPLPTPPSRVVWADIAEEVDRATGLAIERRDVVPPPFSRKQVVRTAAVLPPAHGPARVPGRRAPLACRRRKAPPCMAVGCIATVLVAGVSLDALIAARLASRGTPAPRRRVFPPVGHRGLHHSWAAPLRCSPVATNRHSGRSSPRLLRPCSYQGPRSSLAEAPSAADVGRPSSVQDGETLAPVLASRGLGRAALGPADAGSAIGPSSWALNALPGLTLPARPDLALPSAPDDLDRSLTHLRIGRIWLPKGLPIPPIAAAAPCSSLVPVGATPPSSPSNPPRHPCWET